MSIKLPRITGIYDQKTLKGLISLGVKEIGFDLRPRSFSFIQGYKLSEILENNFSFDITYTLNFENEKREVVDYTISEIDKKFSGGATSHPVNILLHFSGTEDFDFLKNIERPFSLFISESIDLSPYLKMDNFRGVTLDYNYLLDLQKKNELYQFFNQFNQIILQLKNRTLFRAVLAVEWGSEVNQGILKSFPFDNLSLAINSKVEISYRNVDLLKISQNINHYKISE